MTNDKANGNHVWRRLIDDVRRRAEATEDLVSDDYILHAMRAHLYGPPPDERLHDVVVRGAVRRLRLATRGRRGG